MSVPLPLPITTIFIDELTVTLCIGCGAGGALIGVPTDGIFGYNNVAGILSTDTIADAVDKTNELLESILPSPPPSLGTITITLADTLYTAYVAGTSTLRINVQNNSSRKPVTNDSDEFAGADQGAIKAIVKDSVAIPSEKGSVTMTTGDETGTVNGYLTIVSDSDPYEGIPGQEGIYKSVSVRIGGTPSSIALTPGDTEYSYTVNYENAPNPTEVSNTVTFRQDNAYTLTVTVDTTTAVPEHGLYGVNWTSGTYVSGVPTLITTDEIYCRFTVNGAIGKFYNSTAVGTVSSSFTTSASILPTGTDRNEGSNPTFTVTLNPLPGVNTGNLTTTCYGYKSDGTSASSIASNINGKTIRIDTASTASSGGGFISESDRYASGTGQFPAYTGATFDSTQSLALNEELQLIDGTYQYPPAVNYSTHLPIGPNYSSLPAGSYNNTRWATFETINVTSQEFVIVEIENPTGTWGTNKLIPGFSMYVKVDPATGWVDGNAAFPGFGSPVNDGDPALDMANSTIFVRRVTFGLTTRTGVVAVRLGLPQGSDKKFTGITVTAF